MTIPTDLIHADLSGRGDNTVLILLMTDLNGWESALLEIGEQLDAEIASVYDSYSDQINKLRLEDDRLRKMLLSQRNSKLASLRSRRMKVERRLTDVGRMIAAKAPTDPLVNFYRRAIQRHMDLNDCPVRLDRALYAALEGRWEFDECGLA